MNCGVRVNTFDLVRMIEKYTPALLDYSICWLPVFSFPASVGTTLVCLAYSFNLLHRVTRKNAAVSGLPCCFAFDSDGGENSSGATTLAPDFLFEVEQC